MLAAVLSWGAAEWPCLHGPWQSTMLEPVPNEPTFECQFGLALHWDESACMWMQAHARSFLHM
eukprot:5797411-Alexandrium_andersonii.AAC.1